MLELAFLEQSVNHVPEGSERAEAVGVGPVEDAPQLLVLVLQQRAGQPDPTAAPQALQRHGDLGHGDFY